MPNGIQKVSLDLILPNRFQPRLIFDEKLLMNLAESIKKHGIIQPLVLRRLGDKYEIIAGERRFKAATLAGLSEIPAIIVNFDDKLSAEIALTENYQRQNLNPIEEAKTYQKMMLRNRMSISELANMLGISEKEIEGKVKLLDLNLNVQDALNKNMISDGHARSLMKLSSSEQENYLNEVMSKRLTVKELDEEIKNAEIPKQISSNTTTEKKEEIDIFDEINSNNVDLESILNEAKYQENIDDLKTNMNIGHDDIFTNINVDSNESLTYESQKNDEIVEIPIIEEKKSSKIVEGDINSIKKAISELEVEIERANFNVRKEEFDFEDLYQIIIKVEKK